MRRTAEKGSSRKPGFRQILFSEIQWTERAGAPTAPVPRVSFALGPLDKVWRPRRHSLRVFALAVTSYTGTVRHGKGPVYTLYGLFTRDFLRETSPSKRVRFNLIDLVLAALVIILLVLVVRDLMY